MKKGLYAGSFDPLTNGHLWVIKEALNLFDEVLIIIGNNPAKNYAFPVEIRIKFLEEQFKNEPKIRIKAMANAYIAQVAKDEGITYLIRGLRSAPDFEYEKTVLRLNQEVNPAIQSVYLIPPTNLNEISSSNVKSLVNFPGWKMVTESMVPPIVNQYFQIKLYEKKLIPFWTRLMLPSETWWNKILLNYSSHNRYYHTLEHLDELLSYSQKLNLNLFEYQVVILSIFFHDYVYDPQSAMNEEDSATEFLAFAEEVSLHPDISAAVQKFIIATKNHSNENNDPLLTLFLDLDLSILAASPDRFMRYEKEIRKEFLFVPDELYTQERAKIMKKFQPMPFKSEWGKQLESQAQENLKNY